MPNLNVLSFTEIEYILSCVDNDILQFWLDLIYDPEYPRTATGNNPIWGIPHVPIGSMPNFDPTRLPKALGSSPRFTALLFDTFNIAPLPCGICGLPFSTGSSLIPLGRSRAQIPDKPLCFFCLNYLVRFQFTYYPNKDFPLDSPLDSLKNIYVYRAIASSNSYLIKPLVFTTILDRRLRDLHPHNRRQLSIEEYHDKIDLICNVLREPIPTIISKDFDRSLLTIADPYSIDKWSSIVSSIQSLDEWHAVRFFFGLYCVYRNSHINLKDYKGANAKYNLPIDVWSFYPFDVFLSLGTIALHELGFKRMDLDMNLQEAIMETKDDRKAGGFPGYVEYFINKISSGVSVSDYDMLTMLDYISYLRVNSSLVDQALYLVKRLPSDLVSQFVNSTDDDDIRMMDRNQFIKNLVINLPPSL